MGTAPVRRHSGNWCSANAAFGAASSGGTEGQLVPILDQGQRRIRQTRPVQCKVAADDVEYQPLRLGLPGAPEHRSDR